MRLTRRNFLGGSLAIVSAPRFALAQAADGTVILTAEKSEANLLGGAGVKSPILSLMKDKPFGLLNAKQGEEFKGKLINLLDDEVWLQFYGVRGAAESMTINCLPGAENAVDFSFTPPDAGTFWFGPMTKASAQRGQGLYGLLIVEETSPQPLNDVPLIFADWAIDDQGKPKGKFDDLDDAIAEGRMGNWFTVNNQYRPHIKLDRSKPQRLRLLNACNARILDLTFKGADLFVLAEDGQPAHIRPLGDGRLQLYPGQRIDLLAEKTPNPITCSVALTEDSVDLVVLDPSGTAPTSDLPDNFALPPAQIAIPADKAVAREITIAVQGGAKGGMKSAKVGDEEVELRNLLEKGLAWAFNGYAGAGGPPLFEAKKGETLLLTLENTTAFAQPLHIHGHIWKLVEDAGQAHDAEPWRDTIMVAAQSKVQMLMVADNVGTWVLQSTIAERVDAGLLAAFTVAGP